MLPNFRIVFQEPATFKKVYGSLLLRLLQLVSFELLKLKYDKKCFSNNTFHANVPFLYPLKTSENRRLPDICRGYRNVTLGLNGLMMHQKSTRISCSFCSVAQKYLVMLQLP